MTTLLADDYADIRRRMEALKTPVVIKFGVWYSPPGEDLIYDTATAEGGIWGRYANPLVGFMVCIRLLDGGWLNNVTPSLYDTAEVAQAVLDTIPIGNRPWFSVRPFEENPSPASD